MQELNKTNYPLFIDDSELLSTVNINDNKYRDANILCDLAFLRFVNKNNLELIPDSDDAKLEREMLKYGLEITSDTSDEDLVRLSQTLKTLGLV